jgi:hypothetical protein
LNNSPPNLGGAGAGVPGVVTQSREFFRSLAKESSLVVFGFTGETENPKIVSLTRLWFRHPFPSYNALLLMRARTNSEVIQS